MASRQNRSNCYSAAGARSRQARRLFAPGCRFLGLFCLCVFAAGCTTPYRHPVLRPVDEVFPGVADAFTSSDGKPVPEVDLVAIHGIGFHDITWVRQMVMQLAPALGFNCNGNLPDPMALAYGAQLYTATLSDATRRLQFSAVIWSPISSEAKKTLCYDANQVTSMCAASASFSKDHRAYLNGYGKSAILDDLLSEATFYMGDEGGRRVREAVEDALLRALSTDGTTLAQLEAGAVATSKSEPLFVMSESLGSKIIIDSLQELETKKAAEFAKNTRSHTGALFLLANPVPLLNLGARGNSTSGRPDASAHLKAFATARTSRRQEHSLAQVPIHIVAISDPNDLLTYQLPKDSLSRDDAIITNIIVSNDVTYLWLIESLAAAHENLILTSLVADAIALGSAALSHLHSPVHDRKAQHVAPRGRTV